MEKITEVEEKKIDSMSIKAVDLSQKLANKLGNIVTNFLEEMDGENFAVVYLAVNIAWKCLEMETKLHFESHEGIKPLGGIEVLDEVVKRLFEQMKGKVTLDKFH